MKLTVYETETTFFSQNWLKTTKNQKRFKLENGKNF